MHASGQVGGVEETGSAEAAHSSRARRRRRAVMRCFAALIVRLATFSQLLTLVKLEGGVLSQAATMATFSRR